MPETWFSTRMGLSVLGLDAMLACFSEMPRSGFGCGYAVSLVDGAPHFVTKLGPIDEVAVLGGCEFLVGYQGYGAFETFLYDASGQAKTRWQSHGFYAIHNQDIRVIEMETVLPSKMRLVRPAPPEEK